MDKWTDNTNPRVALGWKCHPPLPLKFVKLPILFNFNAYLHDSEHEQWTRKLEKLWKKIVRIFLNGTFS